MSASAGLRCRERRKSWSPTPWTNADEPSDVSAVKDKWREYEKQVQAKFNTMKTAHVNELAKRAAEIVALKARVAELEAPAGAAHALHLDNVAKYGEQIANILYRAPNIWVMLVVALFILYLLVLVTRPEWLAKAGWDSARESAQAVALFQKILDSTSCSVLKHVCSADSSGRLSMIVANETVTLICEGNFKQVNTCPLLPLAPVLSCGAGMATSLFGMADINEDFHLSLAEAGPIVTKMKKRLAGRKCVLAGSLATCFPLAQTNTNGVERISRVRYADVFVPCLVNHMSDTCQATVCAD